jgi:hypothetical protein
VLPASATDDAASAAATTATTSPNRFDPLMISSIS